MRVIRSKGGFGDRIEVAGSPVARVPDPTALARTLERPIGRGGGQRDKIPGHPRTRFNRDRYVTTTVTREVQAWVRQQAADRGLSIASFLGMVVEAVHGMRGDDFDDLLAK